MLYRSSRCIKLGFAPFKVFLLSLFMLGVLSSDVFALSPFERAEVLYVRLRSLQEDIQSGNMNEVAPGQVNTFEAAIAGGGRIVQALTQWTDRGDLDDDDRHEIHEGQHFLAELRDPEADGAMLIEPIQATQNDLEQVERLIQELEVIAGGAILERIQTAVAYWAGILGVNLALFEELEERRALQERVRALRTMFDEVAQHYRRWVLVEGGQEQRTQGPFDGFPEDFLALQFLAEGCSFGVNP